MCRYRAAHTTGEPTSGGNTPSAAAGAFTLLVRRTADGWGALVVVHRERVERLARLLVVHAGPVEVMALGLRLDEGQQRLDGVLHGADETEVDVGAPADVTAADVHLDHRRV